MTTYLVTGAAGKLGRLVIQHLIESQSIAPSSIVAVSRDPAKLTDLAGRGVVVRAGDFANPASLAAAFEGADRLLIISTDAIGARTAQHQAAVTAAKAAGVERIFYTSMPLAERSAVLFAPEHLATETAIAESGLAHTIFRNSWYHENLYLSLPQAFAGGQWFTAAGDGKTAYIARNDIARAIAAGLAKPVEGNITYTLTGETAHSNAEIAALASAATGKPLTVVPITDAQLEAALEGAGLPPALAKVFASIDTAIRAGDLGLVTPDARQLIGGPLQTLPDYITAEGKALAGE